MKRIFAVLLTVVGISLVLLGLLFMLGAAGRIYRYVVAVICLALGGAAAGLGVRFFKQAEAASPQQLRAELLKLAKRRNGEISEADVAAALGGRAPAAEVELTAMVEQGLCEQRRAEGAVYYLFKELQPRLVVRRCEFCRAELPLESEITECPNCGGTIKTQVESRSLSGGDHYSMDE
jgi:hypothetical protein